MVQTKVTVTGRSVLERLCESRPGVPCDVFLTDQGVQSLQCVPQTWAKKKAPELELIVTYKSEDGGALSSAKASGVVSSQ